MGTAFIHPNLQRRCEGKVRFETYQEAKREASQGMKIISCCCCRGFHHTGHHGINIAEEVLTPDEVLEMFR